VTERFLVLGLGNVLLRDEGIGVWVADALRRQYEFPETVMVVDGGTLGLDLLPQLDGVGHLLVIDAVRLGRAPGETIRLEGDEVPAALEVKLSPHQVGVQDLLAAARLTGRDPPHVVLWGMEPGSFEPGTGFSPKVQEALPRLQAAVFEELSDWGVSVHPRETVPPAPIWWEKPGIGKPH
jgi:hydrogenase maturation protease